MKYHMILDTSSAAKHHLSVYISLTLIVVCKNQFNQIIVHLSFNQVNMLFWELHKSRVDTAPMKNLDTRTCAGTPVRNRYIQTPFNLYEIHPSRAIAFSDSQSTPLGSVLSKTILGISP